MQILVGLLLPLLVSGLETMQAGDLVGAIDQREQSVELGFDVPIGFVSRSAKRTRR
jgi:hypothetical protein